MKLLLFLLLVANGSVAQSSQTMNQHFPLEKASILTIAVSNPDLVTVEKIQGSRILVEIKVSISSENSTLLNFISAQGRYNIQKSINHSTQELKLSEPIKKNTILVKGDQLLEEIAYTFYVPDVIEKIVVTHTDKASLNLSAK